RLAVLVLPRFWSARRCRAGARIRRRGVSAARPVAGLRRPVQRHRETLRWRPRWARLPVLARWGRVRRQKAVDRSADLLRSRWPPGFPVPAVLPGPARRRRVADEVLRDRRGDLLRRRGPTRRRRVRRQET